MERTSQKTDLYQLITDLMIEKLEAGQVPWRKPWSNYGLPKNFYTGREYRGINAFLLHSLPDTPPYYLTFRQARLLGGHIRKGARAVPVVYWNRSYREAESGRKLTEEQARQHPADAVIVHPYLKAYWVFPVTATEGIAWQEAQPQPASAPVLAPLQAAEAIVSGMPCPPLVQHEAPQAYYQPARDLVNLPAPALFSRPEEYYSTLFHELIHSTGHRKRLHRVELDELSSGTAAMKRESYSKEELTAELGAAFLCGVAGLTPATVDNSAAYLAGWLRALRNDRKFLVEAAGKAQKAADYIRGLTPPAEAGAPAEGTTERATAAKAEDKVPYVRLATNQQKADVLLLLSHRQITAEEKRDWVAGINRLPYERAQQLIRNLKALIRQRNGER
ncbi:Antirestriction protein ArdC [Catalinimonas alkaloidigena]|uniref:Antirestriction protein ArdC n=1 Tax=Catalinimonas alkaloidigena TaxID=1075417 RepID=A0A1G9U1I9_9BACT|nr:zincin-like metallopeptidase domain-containing protein [Catalinimonas alkaloidigena]SDM53721.1 Antirestriction protein ArdC [Catalinimonas alkaloidigena]